MKVREGVDEGENKHEKMCENVGKDKDKDGGANYKKGESFSSLIKQSDQFGGEKQK